MCNKIEKPVLHWQTLIFWILSAGYLWLWVYNVNPFPDRDSLHQIYTPYLNALHLSGSVSWDPLFLKSAFLDTYPWGTALIPAVIGFLGLSELAVQYPWHLPALFLLPIAIAVSKHNFSFSEKLLFLTVLFFCPTLQIALKSYSYHGLISLLVIPGAVIVWVGMKHENRKLFWIGFSLIWYSATLKHLGAIHLANLMLSYYVWQFLRNQLRKKDVVFGIVIIIALIPFYPIDGLIDYLHIAFSHNPKLSMVFTFITLAVSGILIWTFLMRSAKGSKSKFRHKFFKDGRGVLFLLTLSVLIVSFGADYYSFQLMALSFIIGYSIIYYLLTKVDLTDADGLLTITIAITFTHGCILYFSFLGQIFANFFLPIGLIFVQSFHQSNQRKRVLLAIFCLISSNLSPGLNQCERWFWEWGHLFYTRGLNGLQHNPLGWEPSSLSPIRTDLTNILEQLDFSAEKTSVPILFRGLHFHTRIQFLYPKNVWQPLPELHLPHHLRHDRLEKLALKLESAADTESLISSGAYPIVIYGRKPWTIYPVYKFACSEESFHQSVRSREENWEEKLSDCLVDTIFNKPNLAAQYKIFPLSKGDQFIKVFIHETLLNARKTQSFPGLSEYKEQWKLYQQLPWWKKITFQEVSPSERIFELFRKANDRIDKNDWLGAWKLLQEGLKIEPDHKEMLIDLAIVESHLGLRKIKEPINPTFEIFRKANDYMAKQDWEKAKKLLRQGLELEPNHTEMLKDLAIVEEKIKSYKKDSPK